MSLLPDNGPTFSAERAPDALSTTRTGDAAPVLCSVCLQPLFGRRKVATMLCIFPRSARPIELLWSLGSLSHAESGLRLPRTRPVFITIDFQRITTEVLGRTAAATLLLFRWVISRRDERSDTIAPRCYKAGADSMHIVIVPAVRFFGEGVSLTAQLTLAT